jgi:spore germination cell wall hydrolase CwlJ-like protein
MNSTNERILIAIGSGVVALQCTIGYKMFIVDDKLSKVSDRVTTIEQTSKTTSNVVAKLTKDVNMLTKIAFTKTKPIQLSTKEINCLTRNVFFEAGVEDRAGKLAVAQITLNRLHSKQWGSNLCDVVMARKQFSWTNDSKLRNTQPKGPLWNESKIVVQQFLDGHRINELADSKFYHTDWIRTPKWAHRMDVVVKIGQHIFYRT